MTLIEPKSVPVGTQDSPIRKRQAQDLERFNAIMDVVNRPGTHWKIRQGLLRHQLGVDEETIKALVPSNDPSHY